MESNYTINDIIEMRGTKRADGLFLVAVLKIRGEEIEARGTIKIIGGCFQLLVPNGINIRKRERHISYGPGTKVVRLL